MQKNRKKHNAGKVFISYSDMNRKLADKIYSNIVDLGIDCFFAPHDMPIGAKQRDTLEERLSEANNVILILSQDSINSSWVEYEIETIYEREKITGKTILLPIRMDDEVMKTEKAWAANLRRTRNIGDFTNWQHSNDYEQSFKRLLSSTNKVTARTKKSPSKI